MHRYYLRLEQYECVSIRIMIKSFSHNCPSNNRNALPHKIDKLAFAMATPSSMKMSSCVLAFCQNT